MFAMQRPSRVLTIIAISAALLLVTWNGSELCYAFVPQISIGQHREFPVNLFDTRTKCKSLYGDISSITLKDVKDPFTASSSQLNLAELSSFPAIDLGCNSASTIVSSISIDPAEFLNSALSGLVSGPAILAVPILAGIGLASAVAFFIVNDASPSATDDDDNGESEDLDEDE